MPAVSIIANKLNKNTGENLPAFPVTQWSATGSSSVTLTTANEATYLGGLFNKDTSTNQYFKWATAGAFPVSRLTAATQDNLQKLVNDFGTDSAVILVDKTISITSAMVIPANIKVEFIEGAYFNTPVPATPTVYVDVQNTRNVDIESFGARGDGKEFDGVASITAATNILTVSQPIFSAGDVGKSITIKGAGTLGLGDILVTTITAYTSATQVTIGASAINTVSSARIVFGTDNNNALLRFNTWAKNVTGLVTLNFKKSTKYLHRSTRWPFNIMELQVNFNGSKLINISSLAVDRSCLTTAANIKTEKKDGEAPTPAPFYLINTTEANKNEITLTDKNDAANLTVGEWHIVSSWLISYNGFPPNYRYFDYVKIAAINSSTGVVILDRTLKNIHRSDAIYSTAIDSLHNYTGRAAITSLEKGSKFGIRHIYNDGEFICETKEQDADAVRANGLNVQFNRCKFYSFVPAVAEKVVTNDCSVVTTEIDKLVTTYVDNGSEWGPLSGGTSIINATFNNSRFTTINGLTCRNITFNHCIKRSAVTGTTFALGSREGGINSLVISGGSYNQEPSYSLINGQVPYVSLSAAGVSYSGGILTIPVTTDFASILTRLVEGRRMEVLGAGGIYNTAAGTNNYGIITNVSADGTNAYVNVLFKTTPLSTDTIGIFSEPLYTRIENANIAGKITTRDYLRLSNKPFFTDLTITPSLSQEVYISGGSLKRLVVHVKKAYTGTSTDAKLTISGLYPTTTTDQAISIDLTKVGVREINETGNIGFINSLDAIPANNLALSALYYKSLYRIRTTSLLAGGDAVLPIVDIYFENYSHPLPDTVVTTRLASYYSKTESDTRYPVSTNIAPSTDSATSAPATYTQSQAQSVLDELRDLKTKMRAAGLLNT